MLQPLSPALLGRRRDRGRLLRLALAHALTLTAFAWSQPSTISPHGVVATPDHVLDVLTANVALLPEFAASTRQGDRARRLPPTLVGYDVLVLQEVFVDRWRGGLLAALLEAYPYRTDVVGRDGAGGVPWRQDGGVVILSRWPIERQAAVTYGAVCGGSDCLADKGVAYAAVRKGARTYHVFGTHAQSKYGSRVERVRAAQFALLRSFVDAQRIPPEEPVVIVGDLNVDAFTSELHDMLRVLRAWWPAVVGEARHTWDPQTNAFAHGPRQWLDYVLVATDHTWPVLAWNRVVPMRDGDLDLSDHHAVWGRIVLDDRAD